MSNIKLRAPINHVTLLDEKVIAYVVTYDPNNNADLMTHDSRIQSREFFVEDNGTEADCRKHMYAFAKELSLGGTEVLVRYIYEGDE